MKNIAWLAAFVILATGCKKGPVVVVKDPGPAPAPSGGQIAKSSDGSVSIAVISGWKRGTPDSIVAPTLGESMSGMGEGLSGDFSGMASGGDSDDSDDAEAFAELEKKGIMIWVNDSSRPIPGEERTSYRVKRTDDGPMSVEDAAENAKQDLLNEGAIQYVELPIGKAARMEAKTTKIDGGELYQVVYVLVNGEHVYNIKFTTQNAPTSIQSIEKEVINSLRITPAKAS